MVRRRRTAKYYSMWAFVKRLLPVIAAGRLVPGLAVEHAENGPSDRPELLRSSTGVPGLFRKQVTVPNYDP